MILLINPPVVKPSEPPPGIARLLGALKQHGRRCAVLDANIEALLYLLASSFSPVDTWTKRALRHREENLAALRTKRTYDDIDRYKRSVLELNRLLDIAAAPHGVRLTIANYQDHKKTPAKSQDLLRAAESPEENPFYPYFQKRLLTILEKEQPLLIGFSLNYLSQAMCTFAMIGWLRQQGFRSEIILGGGLITSWVRKPGWGNPFAGLVDHLVAGPGEAELLALAGMQEREGHHYLPDYSLLPCDDYLAPGLIVPYSASTGCYWNACSFCPEKAEGNRYVPIAADKVLGDLFSLTDSLKPALVHMVDNALSPRLLVELAAHPINTAWYGFVRATAHLTDLDLCEALKRSGCTMLKLGLESGDQTVLDQLGKGIILEEAACALKTLKQAGIATYVYLLFGTPPETETAARKTLDFVVRHSDSIDFLNAAVFNLPRYGPEAEMVKTTKFYSGDLSLYDGFVHPHGWDRKKMRIFLDKEFKRHPAIAGILRRSPPFFTSNHAAFFVS